MNHFSFNIWICVVLCYFGVKAEDAPDDVQIGDKRFTVGIGRFFTMDCRDFVNEPVWDCKIHNNNNKLISNKCNMMIYSFEMENVGTWTCTMSGYKNKKIVHKVHIDSLKNDLETIFEEKDGVANMSCKLSTSKKTYPDGWCRASRPDGVYFTISKSAYFDSINDKHVFLCYNLIRLPLKNTEIGRWRIDIGSSEYDFTGCFFNLPNTKPSEIAIPTPKKKTQYLKSGSTLKIRCSVPWPINYCFAQLGDKYRLQSTNPSSKLLELAGICTINIPNISTSMTGTWDCIVSSQSSSKDVVFSTNIMVLDMMQADQDYIKTKRGKDVFFKCNNRLHLNVTCNFIKPSGETISKSDHRFITSFTTFSGCELRIKSVEPEDAGLWLCQDKMLNKEDVFNSAIIFLDVI